MKNKVTLYVIIGLCIFGILLIILMISRKNKNTYDDYVSEEREFQIDTEEVKASRDLKDVVHDNEEYITSKGLTCDLIINSSWEYNTVDDVYISNVYSDGFHAVVISVTNNTIVIDPE